METSIKPHQRSISWPSSLSPSSTKIETELNKLKSLDISSVSALSIESSLICLAECYFHVGELIHSPLIQQAFLQCRDRFLVEDCLEGSMGLLDSCRNVKDLLILMKENVQVLQSALRRKGGDPRIEGEQNIINEVGMVDFVLRSVHKEIRNCEIEDVDVQTAVKRLQNLDSRIEGFESELDCLFRRLIQSRASLLNILDY